MNFINKSREFNEDTNKHLNEIKDKILKHKYLTDARENTNQDCWKQEGQSMT